MELNKGMRRDLIGAPVLQWSYLVGLSATDAASSRKAPLKRNQCSSCILPPGLCLVKDGFIENPRLMGSASCVIQNQNVTDTNNISVFPELVIIIQKLSTGPERAYKLQLSTSNPNNCQL